MFGAGLILCPRFSPAQSVRSDSFDAATPGAAPKTKKSGTLSFQPRSLWFHGIPVGQTSYLPVSVTNTGTSQLTVRRLDLGNPRFGVQRLMLPLRLNPGQSAKFRVSFGPQSQGSIDAQLALISNGNRIGNLPLHGAAAAPPVLNPVPARLDFSPVGIGGTRTLSEKLINRGKTSVTVREANLSPAASGFTISKLHLPITLPAGYSVTFDVSFSPKSSGAHSASLSVLAAGRRLSIPLQGTAGDGGTLTISPRTLNFGNVGVGTSKNQPAALVVTGSQVTVTAATVNSSEFALSGLSFPLTIKPGHSAPFVATFAPQSGGAASADFSFRSNAADRTATEALSGTGTVGSTYSVKLSWQASTSKVAGYNIYRSNKSGNGYQRLNNTLDRLTTFSDKDLPADSTFYYVTTAVDSAGKESGYSNQVVVKLP